ncbi:hypothetical protein ACTMTJ_27875 [Phytohabitans sp. LJ34]
MSDNMAELTTHLRVGAAEPRLLLDPLARREQLARREETETPHD